MEVIHFLVDYCTNLLSSGGIIFGFLLVFLESFIPILPLSIFVALNVNAFGFFIGTLISWISTCLGSFSCYLLFGLMEDKLFSKILGSRMVQRIRKGIHSFQNISLSQLVLIITLPFTPSFFVNILCGIAGVSYEKFIVSIIIGKVFVIIFWGYIGKSFLESLTDIHSLIYIAFALIISYVLSDIVGRKMGIK